jgi:HAD superfamily hydrolase (TIGR01509 family)
LPALILDCDGVLAESERELHLPAFNEAFAEAGIPLHWSEEEYGERLLISGGKERVARSLTVNDLDALELPFRPDTVVQVARQLHARKAELFADLLIRHPPRPRPGIQRVVAAAHDAGWKLAVASTSTEASVRGIARAVLGPPLADRLLILAGDVVAAKKPDPAIYELAVSRLGVAKHEVITIEDSRNGLIAAVQAGLACLITVSTYSRGEDFSESPLVVSSLGDELHPLTVIANRSPIHPHAQVSLSDLEHLAAAYSARLASAKRAS